MFGPRLALLALGAAPLAAQTIPAISPEAIGRHVTRLAADSMRGRATPSRELDRAARYVAGIFRASGLVPLGDSGTYIQRYRYVTTRFVPESSSVRLSGPAFASRPVTWRVGRSADWLPISDLIPGTVSGPVLVITGTPDSTRPFGSLNPRGAVVIHLAQVSDKGTAEAPLWLFRAAAASGVAGWIQVVPRDSAWWAGVPKVIREPRTYASGASDLIRFPVVEVREQSISGSLVAAGLEHAGLRPFPAPRPAPQWLPGYTVRLHLRERILRRHTAPNVIGLLPGTDTAGSGTVLLLAHLDAMGIGEPVGGDSIYNGADDNAAGVASLLEVAGALARGPRPPRDIVFALFSGTERRLGGAEYYLAHPAVPLSETIGVINVEAIGRRHPDSLVVIRGPGSTPLEHAVARTAQTYDSALGLTVVSDLRPQARLWLEGDHSLFFNAGLPILYLYNGPHADLHRPGDNPGKIDFPQTARVARFLALLALAAATPIS
jgi:peptidase M28-like protein